MPARAILLGVPEDDPLYIRTDFALLALREPQPVCRLRNDFRYWWERVPAVGLLVAHISKRQTIALPFKAFLICLSLHWAFGQEPLNPALGFFQLSSNKDPVPISSWK